jgi:hypothetical protein
MIVENNPELVKNQGIRPIISLFPVPESITETGKRESGQETQGKVFIN